MASFGRLRVAFRGAMAFSFHFSMCSGMPLTSRDTTALFSRCCSYRKPYAMVIRLQCVWWVEGSFVSYCVPVNNKNFFAKKFQRNTKRAETIFDTR